MPTKQEQEVSKAHIPLAVAIRGCNTFREKTNCQRFHNPKSSSF